MSESVASGFRMILVRASETSSFATMLVWAFFSLSSLSPSCTLGSPNNVAPLDSALNRVQLGYALWYASVLLSPANMAIMNAHCAWLSGRCGVMGIGAVVTVGMVAMFSMGKCVSCGDGLIKVVLLFGVLGGCWLGCWEVCCFILRNLLDNDCKGV